MDMKREGQKPRKTREDKKKSIAPFIPDEYRVWIHRISVRADIPNGEVGLRLIQLAIQNEACMYFFQPYFKRSFAYTPHMTFFGDNDHKSIYDYIGEVKNENSGRFKIKVSQAFHDQLSEFQLALGVPFLAHATYALLRYALNDLAMVQHIAPGMTREELTGPLKPVVVYNVKDKPKSNVKSVDKSLEQPSNVWSILK